MLGNTIGERIKVCRKTKGFTQEELSQLLYVSHQTLSKWETGVLFPDIEKLVSIAGLFQVSLDFLCGVESGFEQMISSIISDTDYSRLDNFEELLELYQQLENRTKSFSINERLLIHKLRFLRWMHDNIETDAQKDYANDCIFSIAQKILDISQNDEYRSYANYNMSVYFCEQIPPTETTKHKAVEYGEKVLFKDMTLSYFCIMDKPFASVEFAHGCLEGLEAAVKSIKAIITNYARHLRLKGNYEKYEALMKYAENFKVSV